MADLDRFCEDLHQDVLTEASAAPAGALQADVYTRRMIDYLTEAGEVDDGEVVYHRARGVEVSGYSLDEDLEQLSVFVSLFTQRCPPTTVTKSDVDTAFRRLRTFVERCRDGYADELEVASPSHDMALAVVDALTKQFDVRLYFLTDGIISRGVTAPGPNGAGISAYEIWDLERLFRCVSSGRGREPVQIDLDEVNGAPIPCLRAEDAPSEYEAYLLILPGTVLNAIYERYGPRVLELNVRSFLQVRGKVNKGIRETILHNPDRFLAYNNGIAATASQVGLVPSPGGGWAISRISDFQIVNGGQTTATIHHAVRRDRADVSGVNVQAKLTVVPPDKLASFVPLVSRFANTQNRVNEADFSANDPFHVRLQELSRTVWAPAIEGTARQTKWFYERARGQYQDALSRAGTPARQQEFKRSHPARQRFTKTDLAKFINSWNQKPEIVSRGSEKNFREFTADLARHRSPEVDETFFRHIVAKAIIFRKAEELISKLAFPGYRANVVTYSIAYLSHITGQRVDLENIWRQQDIPASLASAVETVARSVYEEITRPPGGGNVTEWCKRPACWERIRDLRLQLPKGLFEDVRKRRVPGASDGGVVTPRSDAVRRAESVEAEKWFTLAQWAKETDNLTPWQRRFAYSMGEHRSRNRDLSERQAEQAVKILDEAARIGFRPSAD